MEIKRKTLSRETVLVPEIPAKQGYKTVLIKTLQEIETVYRTKTKWEYSEVIADLLCKGVAEGMTIKQLSELEGAPSRFTIARWITEIPDFKARMQAARKGRAEHFHDRVIEEADKITEKNAKSKRVQIDALKWAAKVGSPEDYGEKTTIEGNPDKPVTFVISTGIQRNPIEVPATVIEEKKNVE